MNLFAFKYFEFPLKSFIVNLLAIHVQFYASVPDAYFQS